MGVVFFPSLPFMGVMLFPSFDLGNASGGGSTLLMPPSLFFYSSFSSSHFFSFSFLSSFLPHLILPFPFSSAQTLSIPFLFLLFSISFLSFSFLSFSLSSFLLFFHVSFSIFLFLPHKLLPSFFFEGTACTVCFQDVTTNCN